MNDNQTTLLDLKNMVDFFAKERDWKKFYTAKSLLMNLSVETAELMEIFTWARDEEIPLIIKNKRENIEFEVADILYSLLAFCNKYNIDLAQSMLKKLKNNEQKYPVLKARGKNKKYNEL